MEGGAMATRRITIEVEVPEEMSEEDE